MNEDPDAQFLQRFRKSLEQTLANCNRLLADAARTAQRHPEVATGVAQDKLAEAYTLRQRALTALVMLDGGEDRAEPTATA